MENKSIKKNAILNTIKVLMSVIFPLITFPYATRVLGTDNIGKVQFVSSFITFFTLLATLGINNYAVREGATYRENRKKISEFASEIFSVNLVCTLLSYIVLFIIILIPSKLTSYITLIIIQSIQIFFTTIGVDWIYTIYEDYLYITIRAILVQIISLILLFLLVHDNEDYYVYALITVIANSGVNILNFFHSKKYVDLKFKIKNNFKVHIKPMIVLFSNDLAQQVYINSDSLMLGIMTTDYNVGIYSVAVKIYTIIKRLINAIVAVAIPRMAYYNSNDEKEFTKLCSKIFNISTLILLPLMVLLFLLGNNIVEFIFGNSYIESGIVIKILSVGLIFAVLANIFCNGVLIIKKKEKFVLRATIIAATVNFVLNFIFIHFGKQNGAAATTVIAEFIVMIYSYWKSKEYIEIINLKHNILSEILGCIGIIIVYMVLKKLNILNNFVFIGLVGTIGLLIYILILYVLKNESLIYFKNQIQRKINGKN